MRQDWELDIFLWGRNNFRNLIIYSLLYNQHRRSIWLCTSARNYGHSVESSTSWSISYWYPWWPLMFGRVSPYLSPHWTCRSQMDPRVGGGCCDINSYIYNIIIQCPHHQQKAIHVGNLGAVALPRIWSNSSHHTPPRITWRGSLRSISYSLLPCWN